jgi:hypothetical protein
MAIRFPTTATTTRIRLRVGTAMPTGDVEPRGAATSHRGHRLADPFLALVAGHTSSGRPRGAARSAELIGLACPHPHGADLGSMAKVLDDLVEVRWAADRDLHGDVAHAVAGRVVLVVLDHDVLDPAVALVQAAQQRSQDAVARRYSTSTTVPKRPNRWTSGFAPRSTTSTTSASPVVTSAAV